MQVRVQIVTRFDVLSAAKPDSLEAGVAYLMYANWWVTPSGRVALDEDTRRGVPLRRLGGRGHRALDFAERIGLDLGAAALVLAPFALWALAHQLLFPD